MNLEFSNIFMPDNGRVYRSTQFLMIAHIISLRGNCHRGKNGAIITQDNRIVSTGYNGPLGKGDCLKLGCDLSKGCEKSVHAERNAIYFASRFGIKLEGGILFSTSAPCFECAQAIIQAGIKSVYYSHDYRNADGLNELSNNKVYHSKLIVFSVISKD
jgi:dCMP deaminase